MSNPLNAQQFVEQMKRDEDFRWDIEVKLIEEGVKEDEWDKLVEIAKNYESPDGVELKFDFTKEELIAALPEDFFLGHGQHSDEGWHEVPK